MKMKKFFSILSIFIFALTGLIFGCKGKYDDFSIYVEGETSIVLHASSSVETDRTHEITIKYKNAPNKNSKNVTYKVATPNMLLVELVEQKDNYIKFKISPLDNISSDNMTTDIIFTSAEGNKSCRVAVEIRIEITNFIVNSDYSPYVVADGKYYNINTAKAFTFEPSNTSQKDIKYTLADETLKDRYGIDVLEDGRIKIDSLVDANGQGLSSFDVVATSSYNDNLSRTISVNVLKALALEDFSIITNGADSNSATKYYQLSEEKIQNLTEAEKERYLNENFDALIKNGIVLSSNNDTKKTSLFQVVLNAESGLMKENLNITLDKYILNNVTIDKSSFLITALNPSVDYLTLNISYKNYEEYKLSLTIPVVVKENATEITVNSSNKLTYDVFDYYENLLGQPFKINIGKSNAYDKTFKMQISRSDFEKFIFTYNGMQITLNDFDETSEQLISKHNFENNSIIYVKAKTVQGSDENAVLTFIANGGIDLTSQIELNIIEGITSLAFSTNKQVLYVAKGETLSLDGESFLTYKVNGNDKGDKLLDKVNLTATKENLIKITKATDSYKFEIKGLEVGETSIKLVSENGVESDALTIIVYNYSEKEELDEIFNLEFGANLKYVDDVYYLGLEIGTNSANITIKNDSEITVNSTNVEVENEDVLYAYKVSQNGLIYQVQALSLGETTLTISVKIFNENSLVNGDNLTKEIKKTLTIKTYYPITDVTLKAPEVDVIDGANLDLDSLNNKLNVLNYDDIFKVSKKVVGDESDEINLIKISYNIPNGYSVHNKNLATNNVEEENADIIIGTDNSLTFMFGDKGFSNGVHSLYITAKVYDILATEYYPVTFKVNVKEQVKPYEIKIDEKYGFVYLTNTTSFYELKAEVKGINEKEPTNKNLEFKVMDESVLSITSEGIITPKSSGTTKIIVYAKGSKYSEKDDYSISEEVNVVVADGSQGLPYILSDFSKIEENKNYTLASDIVAENGFIDTFSGTIDGSFVYKNNSTKNYSGNFKLISKTSGYLFENIALNGTIKNLDVVIDFQTTEENSYALFVNNNAGTLENINLSYSGNFNFNFDIEMSIGLLASINNETVKNCMVSGNLNIITKNNMTFGGLVGENNGTVLGSYDFYDKNSTKELNSTLNLTIKTKSGDVIVGSLVGLSNSGAIVKNLNSKAVIRTNAKILGGIVGKIEGNNTTVENCLFSGILNSDNTGASIGGVAGEAVSTNFNLCLVNFTYQNTKMSSTEKAFITGSGSVGGLVGTLSGTSSIKNSYVQSLVKYGAIAFTCDILASGNVGGLIGQVESDKVSISVSFADVEILESTGTSNIGGLIGTASDFEMNNVYSLVNATKNTQTTQTLIGGFVGQATSGSVKNAYTSTARNIANGSNITSNNVYTSETIYDMVSGGELSTSPWAKDITINSGFPYLTIGSHNLLMQEPQSINARFKINNRVNENSNYYYGANKNVIVINDDDKQNKALIYFSENLQLSISEFLNIVVIPNGGTYDILSSDTSVLSVVNNTIKIHKTGNVTLKVYYSNGSEEISAKVYIAIVNKAQQLSVQDTFEMLKGKTKQLNIKTSGEFGLEFNFDADVSSYLLYNNNLIDGQLLYTNGKQHIFTALNEKDLITYTLTPYYEVVFGEESYKVKDYDFEKTNLTLAIKTGATGISSNTTNIYLTEKQTVSFNVEVENNTTETGLKIANQEFKFAESNNPIEYSIGFDDNIMLLVNVEKDNNSFVVNISTSRVIEEQKTIELKICPLTNEGISLSVFVTLMPSKLLSVELAHYNTITTEDKSNKIKDTPSCNITPGELGVLQINLHPSYANLKKVLIKTSAVNGASIQLAQLAIDETKENSLTYVKNNGFENRALLLDFTTSKITESGKVFDGNLYVSTMLPSSVAINTIFTITVICYDALSSEPITQEIQLKAIPLPGAYLAKNNETNIQMAKGTELILDVIKVNAENVEPNFTVPEGVELSDVSENGVKLENKKKVYVDILADVNNFEIKTSVQVYINGKVETIENITKISVVDYVINDAYVENAESSIIESNLGSNTILKAKLNVTMADPSLFNDDDGKLESRQLEYERILLRVRAMEESISKLSSTFNTISRNSNGSYVYSNIVPNTTYTNFKTTEQNGYLVISGTKVSSQEIIMLINYTYDLNGYVKIATNTGYEISKNLMLEIKTYTTKDNPFPITTYEQFIAMNEGESYILLNDITLPKDYAPTIANFESLDGNGYTINLQGFALTESDNNVGLFSEIQENTVVKNLKINILPNTFYIDNAYKYGFEVDALSLESLNFGVLCGVNYGVITNCSVVNENNLTNKKDISINVKSEENNNINVSMFVADNQGYITNSRVNSVSDTSYQSICLYSKANTSAFVVSNSGKIASSYAANVAIVNKSQQLSTAGFVVTNTNQIITSFVEGNRQNTDSDGRILGGGIGAIGNVGGFVYTNKGNIKDCYSNIAITTNMRSAGFVYNNTDGSINTCYSASKIQEESSSYRYFTGNNEENIVLNSKGGIKQSYYLTNNLVNGSDMSDYSEPANGISTFDENSLEGFVSGTNGIWNINEKSLPTLIDAISEISVQRKLLDNSQLTDDKTTKYNYTYVNYAVGTEKNPIIVSNTQEFIDAITDDENLYSYYLFGRKIETNINYKNIRLVKDIDLSVIVNDDESFDSQEEVQKLQNIIFAGNLNGNGLDINNIIITAESLNIDYDSFGLFKQIGVDFVYNADKTTTDNLLDEDGCSVVKNINFNINSISATVTRSVGVLTGEVINSKLYNVNVNNNNNVVVTGKNMVGGIAGRISGRSKVSGVSSNVSVHSTFNADIINNAYKEVQSKKINSVNYGAIVETEAINNNIGYVGGLFGVVDIYDVKIDALAESTTSYSKQTLAQVIRTFNGSISINNNDISYAKVSGDIQIVGETAGGLFGYVATNSAIHDVMFELTESSTQNIIANYSAGGISGENHGKLNFAAVSLDKYLQEECDQEKTADELRNISNNLFSATSNKATYVGGLAGINKNGAITYSYNRANVIAKNSRFVGGLVGLFDGGQMIFDYTTANVEAQEEIVAKEGYTTQLKGYAGGIIGRLNSYIESNFDVSNLVGANNFETGNTPKGYNLAKFAGYNAVTQHASLNNFETITGDLPYCFGSSAQFNGKTKTFENYKNKGTDCFLQYNSDENWDTVNFIFPVLTYNAEIIYKSVEGEDELRNMVTGGKYELTKDVYLTSPWSPVYAQDITLTSKERDKSEWSTHGTKYYKIYNLNIVTSENATSSTNISGNIGFFSTLSKSTVKDITFVVGTTYKDPKDSSKAPEMESNAEEDENWKQYSELGIRITNKTNSNSTLGIFAGTIAEGSTVDNVTIITKNAGEVQLQTNLSGVGTFAGRITDSKITNINLNCLSSEFVTSYQAGFKITANQSNNNTYIGGLSGYIEKADIGDVNISGIEINKFNDNSNIGLICGKSKGKTKITKIKVANSTLKYVQNTEDALIIKAGYGFGSYEAEYTDAGSEWQFSFEKCTVDINAKGIIYAGGFAGELLNSSTSGIDIHDDCSMDLKLKENSSGAYVGGIIGKSGSTSNDNFINNSYSNGKIKLEYNGGSSEQIYVGGLVGRNGFIETIKKTTNNKISTTDTSYAGLTISNDYSKVKLHIRRQGKNSTSGEVYIGGIIGYNNGKIENVFSLTSIKAISNDVISDNTSTLSAGIAKNKNGTITNVICAEDLADVSKRNEEYGVEFKSYEDVLNSINTLEFDTNKASDNNSGISILNPIRITSVADWNNMADTKNYYYILNNDLTIENTIDSFNNILIGNGHTITLNAKLFKELGEDAIISNVNIIAKTNKTNSYNLSLEDDCLNSNTVLADTNNGVIFGVNLAGNTYYQFNAVTVESQNVTKISSFVIENSGTIINCSTKVNMLVSASQDNENDKYDEISGFVNKNEGLILNSYSTANLEMFKESRDINYIVANSWKNISGFIHDNEKFVINCYSATTLPESTSALYPFENKQNGVVENCYFDVNAVTKYASKSEDDKSSATTNANPVQTSEIKKENFGCYSDIWQQNNKINYSYIYISNSSEYSETDMRSTYSIENAYEINHLATLKNISNILETDTGNEVNFVLTKNIEANVLRTYKSGYRTEEEVITEYIPIELSKKVTFDGNGFAIKNLTLKSFEEKSNSMYDLGLFYNSLEAENSSTIKNLALSNLKFEIDMLQKNEGSAYIGGFVAYGNINLENCYAEGLIETNIATTNNIINRSSTLYVGGLAGKTSGTIKNCVSNVEISLKNDFVKATGYLGGISGKTTNSITNSMSLNKIRAKTFNELYMGGVSGELELSEAKDFDNILTLSQVIYDGFYQHYYKTYASEIYYNLNAVFGKINDINYIDNKDNIKYSKKLSLIEDENITSQSILNNGTFFAKNNTTNYFVDSENSVRCLLNSNDIGSLLNPNIINSIDNTTKFENNQNYIVNVETITLKATTEGTETITIGEYNFKNGYIIFDYNNDNTKVNLGEGAVRLFNTLTNAIVAGIDFIGDNSEKSTNGILANSIENTTINNVNVKEMFVTSNKKVEETNPAGLVINKAENSVITNVNVENGRFKAGTENQSLGGIIGYAKSSTLYKLTNSATITSATISASVSGIVAKASKCSINFVENNGLIYNKGTRAVSAAGICANLTESNISFSKNTAKVQASAGDGAAAKVAGLAIIIDPESNSDAKSSKMYYCFNSGNVISIGTQESNSSGLLGISTSDVSTNTKYQIYYSYNKGAIISNGKIFALTNGTTAYSNDTKLNNVDYCYNIGGGYSSITTTLKLTNGKEECNALVGIDNLMEKTQIDNIEITYSQKIQKSSEHDLIMDTKDTNNTNKKMYFPVIAIIDDKYELPKDENGTYQISTAFDLYYWLSFVGAGDVEILKDIDMSGFKTKPIVTEYTGKFDGKNHQISDIIITESSVDTDNSLYVGFIAKNSGIITNINFVDPQIINSTNLAEKNYLGVVAGINNGSIENVMVSASRNGIKFISSSYSGEHAGSKTIIYTGGIAGQNNGTINLCEVMNLYSGATINLSYTFAAIKLKDAAVHTGGLVGQNTNKIINSCHFGYMSISVDNSGRLVQFGDTLNFVADLVLTTPVARLDSWTGPIAGANRGSYENVYASSNLDDNTENPSTVIGYNFVNAAWESTNNQADMADAIWSDLGTVGTRILNQGIKGAVVAADIGIRAAKLAKGGKTAAKVIDKVVDGVELVGKVATKAAMGPVGWALLVIDVAEMGVAAYNSTTNLSIIDRASYAGSFTNDYSTMEKFNGIYGEFENGTLKNAVFTQAGENLPTATSIYVLKSLSSHDTVYSVPKYENGKYYIYSADELAYAIQAQKEGINGTFVLMNTIDLSKKLWETSETSNITIIDNGFEIIYPTGLTIGNKTATSSISDNFGATDKVDKDNSGAKLSSFDSAFKALSGYKEDAIKNKTYKIYTKDQLYLIGFYLNLFKDDPVWSNYLNFTGIEFVLQDNITLDLVNDFKTKDDDDKPIENPLNKVIKDKISGDFITAEMIYSEPHSYMSGIDYFYGTSGNYVNTLSFNGEIDGNGKTITIKNGTLFNSTGPDARIENLSVKVITNEDNTIEVGSQASIGFVVNNNKGTISNVDVKLLDNDENEISKITISRTISQVNSVAVKDSGTISQSVEFGLLCGYNEGTVENCSVSNQTSSNDMTELKITFDYTISESFKNKAMDTSNNEQTLKNVVFMATEYVGGFVGNNEGKITFDSIINSINLKVSNSYTNNYTNADLTFTKPIYSIELGAICGAAATSSGIYYPSGTGECGIFNAEIKAVKLNVSISGNTFTSVNIGGITGSLATNVSGCKIYSFDTGNSAGTQKGETSGSEVIIGLLVGTVCPELYVNKWENKKGIQSYYYDKTMPNVTKSYAIHPSKDNVTYSLVGKSETLYYKVEDATYDKIIYYSLIISTDNKNWTDFGEYMMSADNSNLVYIDGNLITEKVNYSSDGAATISTKEITFDVEYDDTAAKSVNATGETIYDDTETITNTRNGVPFLTFNTYNNNSYTKISGQESKIKIVATSDATDNIYIGVNYYTTSIPINEITYEKQTIPSTDENGNTIYIDNLTQEETLSQFDEDENENQVKMIEIDKEVKTKIREYKYTFTTTYGKGEYNNTTICTIPLNKVSETTFKVVLGLIYPEATEQTE